MSQYKLKCGAVLFALLLSASAYNQLKVTRINPDDPIHAGRK
jgi:hypothetical protein